MVTAVLNYGHPPLFKEKREQRNRLFKGMEQFHFIPNYITAPNHQTVYLMEDVDKLENVTYFDYFRLLNKAQYYFPEPFKKLVDPLNTINSLTANYSVQQSLNELIFWLEFQNSGGRDFDKIIFMSNSFYCEDEEWFANQIKEHNWFIYDYNYHGQAKGIWSCKSNIYNEILDRLQILATTHWRDFNSSTRFNNDSETFKFKLFYEEFDLKPIPPHGMVKQRIDLPKNGHPIRIEIGCRKWVYGRY